METRVIMANKGIIDKDLGLKDILKEVEKLKSMCVKVGVTDDVGGETVDGGPPLIKIATWNERGVKGPPYSETGDGIWFIPPRPFVSGWADGKREQIANTMERLGKQVASGKLDADTAIRRIGEYGQDGVKTYIRNGPHKPNADRTVKIKTKGKGGKTTPLIDTGTLRNSIRFQIIEKPVTTASEK
jgi:hypothetical protein